MSVHVIPKRKVRIQYLYSDLFVMRWLSQITYSPMSIPSPIFPVGNHYNEFGVYPANVFIFFKCMSFYWPIPRVFLFFI